MRRLKTWTVAVAALAIAAVPVSQTIMEKVRGDQSVLPDLWKGVPTRESLKQLFARGWQQDRKFALQHVGDFLRPRQKPPLRVAARVMDRETPIEQA